MYYLVNISIYLNNLWKSCIMLSIDLRTYLVKRLILLVICFYWKPLISTSPSVQHDAAGKFESARTISSPWPILAIVWSNSGDKILGIPFKRPIFWGEIWVRFFTFLSNLFLFLFQDKEQLRPTQSLTQWADSVES